MPGWPALAVLGARLAWAIDNNLTRQRVAHRRVLVVRVRGRIADAVTPRSRSA
jgi:hypothetical protein